MNLMIIVFLTWFGSLIAEDTSNGCNQPIKVGHLYENRKSKGSIKVSSSLSHLHTPKEIDLFTGKAWCAEVGDSYPWIQINFPQLYTLTAITIQGRKEGDKVWFIYRYQLKYPSKRRIYNNQWNSGPHRKENYIHQYAIRPNVTTKSVRVELSRRDWWPPTGSACLRLGFHGCIGKQDNPWVVR